LQDMSTTQSDKGGLIGIAKDSASTVPAQINDDTSDASTELGIKCAMIVYGVMQISELTEDEEEKSKLTSKLTWDKAESLLSHLFTHLGTDSPAFDDLQREYDDFLEYLKSVTVWELPAEYGKLKTRVKKVPRPFHAQTLQLLLQCKALAIYFKAHKSAKNLSLLTDAITAVVPALTAAADSMPRISAYNVDDIVSGTAADAFAAAEVKIGESFVKFQMTTEWDNFKNEMKNAVTADKHRVTQLNAKISAKGDDTNYPKQASITFKLKTADASDPDSFTDSARTAEDNTRLSAILFKESLSNKELLRGWHFEQDGENNSRESIGFDKEVKDIRGDGQRTLYLVPTIPPSADDDEEEDDDDDDEEDDN